MKRLIKRVMETFGYTIINSRALRAKEKQITITRRDFFNLYFSKVDPERFFFVEIGASDGIRGDPIWEYTTKYRLKGVVVEPIPESFARLQKSYSGYPVTCVQAAIGDASGTLPFYTISEEGRKEKGKKGTKGDKYLFLLASSSLSKTHLEDHLRRYLERREVEKFIAETNVRALSFSDLAKECDINRIDALQIDAEGYDWKILQTVDFSRFSPSLINIETENLTPEDYAACMAFLEKLGYKTFRIKADTVAYKA